MQLCDPLGKNLLFPSRFTKDFEEESFASLLGFFWCIGLTREESSASILEILWGRIFCFLIVDCFNVLGLEESSASSMGMVLDTLELLRKSLLHPH